jgi:hypothetical protein
MADLTKKVKADKIIKFLDPLWEGYFRVSVLMNEKHPIVFLICG